MRNPASRFLPAAILFALGVALYESTLSFPFIFDDMVYLVGNPLVHETRSFWFLGDFHAFANRATALGLDRDLSTNFILRPFAYLTFHLNYLVGGLHPAGYRAVNILIHCANAALLFTLAARLLRTARGLTPASGSVNFIAWTASLLFLVHPLQIESVTYVVQRFTSLGTFFFLGSVLLFVVARTTADEAVARRCRRWSVTGLLIGMLTKEFLFTAPFAMVLLDWLVLGAPLRQACRRAVPWLLCLPLIPTLIILTAAAQSSGGATFSSTLTLAGASDGSADYPLRYALTQPGVIVTYLRLLVFPSGLNLDPTHPLATSLLDGRVLGSLAALLALLAAASWWRARHVLDPRSAIGCCGVLWFFLTLGIDSSVVPLPDVMAEHRAYLPSIGILIAVACLGDLARRRLPRLVPAAAAACILALAAATVARNEVWRTPIALWTDTVEKSPRKGRAWLNLGTSYCDTGRWSRGAECYRRVIALEPRAIDARLCLANAENASGRPREALAAAEAGLRVNPNVHDLHIAAAKARAELGDLPGARASLENSVALRPRSRRARLGLAGVHLQMGNPAKAAQHLEVVRTLGPLDAEQQRVFREIEAGLTRLGRRL